MRMKSALWGVIFILLGAAIILSRFGFFEGIGMFDLAVTALMIPIFISGIKNLEYFCIFFPIAVVCILYDKELGIQMLTPWPVLGTALCLSIGMYLLFPKFSNTTQKAGGFISDEKTETQEAREIYICKSFSGCSQYINSVQIQTVNVNVAFSDVKLYFDNVSFDEDAQIKMNARFSCLQIFIPKDYMIETAFNNIAAKVKNDGEPRPDAKAVKMLGNNLLSDVVVHYI